MYVTCDMMCIIQNSICKQTKIHLKSNTHKNEQDEMPAIALYSIHSY